MKFSQSLRAFKTLAVVMALAMPAMMAISAADAKPGGGGSMGSRGSKTFAAPPATKTAPTTAQPMQRTITQPGTTAPAAAPAGGFFNRPGMGMLGGLAAGFLGAGLLGMLFGGGFMSGLGGFASILGLIIQVVLVVVVARLAWGWWQRRKAGNSAAYASGPSPSTPSQFDAQPQQPQQSPYAASAAPLGGGAGGSGGGFNNRPVPLQIKPDDYDAFERMLGDIQNAWSHEDNAKLQELATPEMASYLQQDLAANATRGVVNKVTGVKLLQGDLAEAWSEGPTDYATLAMRYALTDKTVDRTSGKIVEGSETPGETTEVWTFARRHGGNWELSAIQQTG